MSELMVFLFTAATVFVEEMFRGSLISNIIYYAFLIFLRGYLLCLFVDQHK